MKGRVTKTAAREYEFMSGLFPQLTVRLCGGTSKRLTHDTIVDAAYPARAGNTDTKPRFLLASRRRAGTAAYPPVPAGIRGQDTSQSWIR